MTDRRDDPTDHARTTLPRAGEAMKDSRSLGGYALLGVAILALVICIGAVARGVMDWATGAVAVALVTAAVGAVWVYAERRRVARVARENAIDPEPPGAR
jgi:thiol:disulfide interchange protein